MFFLDYFATGKLDGEQFKVVLNSLKKSLAQVNCPLVGGETAELPGLYEKGHFDMAGFVVGIAEKSRMPDFSRVEKDHVLLAIPSSGFHSNGYSLLRKWVQEFPDLQHPDMINYLLTPTRIYDFVEGLYHQENAAIIAMSHITGGGFDENIPRILPDHLAAKINLSQLKIPTKMQEVFSIAQHKISDLTRVFNLGVGMVLVCKESGIDVITAQVPDAYVLGKVVERQDQAVVYG